MTVTNYELPTPANAGTDQDICSPLPTTSFMTANTPLVGSGMWTQISGPGIAVFANPTDPVTQVSNLIQGTYLFQWAITNGVCTSSMDTVRFRLASMAIASAGPDDSLCANIPYLISGASASNYSSLQWTHNGLGTLSSTTIPNPTYIPAPNESGVVTFTLTVSAIYRAMMSLPTR